MSTQPVFIPVGDLADGFAPDSHILPFSPVLQGQQLVLHFADGSSASLQVNISDCQLTALSTGTATSFTGQGKYRASSLRPGIVLLDFLPEGQHGHSLSLVLDLAQASFTAVAGQLPTGRRRRPFSLQPRAVRRGADCRALPLCPWLHQPAGDGKQRAAPQYR
jgi:hypothetical protein